MSPKKVPWTVVAAMAALVSAGGALAEPAAGAVVDVRLNPKNFQIVQRDSGPVNYYSVVDGPDGAFIHAAYKPPYETAVLGYGIPEKRRHSIAKIRWKWRALALPKGGDECTTGHGDSAAAVYLTWKNGLKWYVLKYVWSAQAPRGQVCDPTRNPIRAQDTIIVESGGPLNEWKTFEVDPDFEFRKHFENGDPKADPPDLIGIGIMSDGDQTHSPSEADYADFVLSVR